jgi:hypothetical protein
MSHSRATERLADKGEPKLLLAYAPVIGDDDPTDYPSARGVGASKGRSERWN